MWRLLTLHCSRLLLKAWRNYENACDEWFAYGMQDTVCAVFFKPIQLIANYLLLIVDANKIFIVILLKKRKFVS